MKRVRERRITVTVDADIEEIRLRLISDTGVRMTYKQLINFLIHHYQNNKKCETAWRP